MSTSPPPSPKQRPPSLLLSLAALLGLQGCSTDSPNKAPPTPSLEAVALFETEPRPALAPCPGTSPSTIEHELSVQVWLGPGVDTEQVLEQLRTAQSVFAAHGLQLRAAGDSRSVTHETLLVGEVETLKRTLEVAARDKGRALSEAEENHLFAEAVTGPLRSFIAGLRPRHPLELQVVFMESLVASKSPAASLRSLAGLTFSPLNQSAEARALRDDLELGALPAPLVLLSTRDIQRTVERSRPTILAHELGHALGLEHRGTPDFLMSLTRNSHCNPGFDARELEAIAQALSDSK